jgi:cell division septal protein FtsQ
MDDVSIRPDPAAEAERKRRQRARSIAIALVLAGLVVLFYVITIVQMGANAPGSAP